MFGPLKEDTSKTCKIKEWTHAQAMEKCVPVQYVLYGSKNVARLQAIKETIDPNYMLDCQSCIGTETLANAELEPADGDSEARETTPTDSGEAGEKIEPATENTGGSEAGETTPTDSGEADEKIEPVTENAEGSEAGETTSTDSGASSWSLCLGFFCAISTVALYL